MQYCRTLPHQWAPIRTYGNSGHARRDLTFEDIGVHPIIVKALQAAFPKVRNPTQIQSEFVPAILSGKDVLLKDDTGTGKSFGLMLALLSKPRVPAVKSEGVFRDKTTPAAITSLVLVPHRDLAYQLYHWIESIVKKSPKRPHLPSVVQMLVRGAAVPVKDQISQLHGSPPHVLVGTPQAVQEVFNEDRAALQLDSLSTVVVDEVDYLIDAVPRNASTYKRDKVLKNIRKHPGPTRELLNFIYDRRRGSVESSSGCTAGRSPQLVMTSATFRVSYQNEVLQSGWFQGEVIKVTGSSTADTGSGSDDNGHSPSLSHCVLVVSQEGRIKNIEGAVEAQAESPDDVRSGPESSEEAFPISDDDADEIFQPKLDSELRKKFTSTPSPFDPALLEAVAAAFALDVPRLALLVLPAVGSVKRAVFELQQLGVNAQGLDLFAEDQGRKQLLNNSPGAPVDNPVLLVSTWASTRGLDLPELSHVFVLGVPEGRRVDTYLHVAGRTGRFGRSGKVVTVVEDRREVVRPDGKKIVQDDPKRMAVVLKEIGIVPVKFEHFD